MPGAFWDKFIYFTTEPVVQCDVRSLKNTSLDDDDDDDDDDDVDDDDDNWSLEVDFNGYA